MTLTLLIFYALWNFSVSKKKFKYPLHLLILLSLGLLLYFYLLLWFPHCIMFYCTSDTIMVICLIPDYFYSKFVGIFTGKFPKLQGQQIIFIKQNRWQKPLYSLWHCCFRNLQVQMLRKRWSFVHWDQYLLLVSHCVKIMVNISSFYDPVTWVYLCNCLWAFVSLFHFNKKIVGSNAISEL